MTFDYTEFNTVMYLFLVQSAHRSHKVYTQLDFNAVFSSLYPPALARVLGARYLPADFCPVLQTTETVPCRNNQARHCGLVITDKTRSSVHLLSPQVVWPGCSLYCTGGEGGGGGVAKTTTIPHLIDFDFLHRGHKLETLHFSF